MLLNPAMAWIGAGAVSVPIIIHLLNKRKFVRGLALARPTVRSFAAGGWLGEAKVTAVVLLDNSYSMTATDGAKSRFELAKDAADQAIASLPTGSSVCVLFASDFTPTGPIPEPTFDLGLARRTIKEARVSD